MPLRLVMAALSCAGLSVPARGEYEDDETELPYRAYITTDNVYIRSGPGTNYYPVMRLKRGDVVEVYRHDPGGWYAIRPLGECFSWISAEFVEPREGNMAEVIGERVVARVGSSFSDIRDVIQVRLDRGEQVQVIEARRFGEGPAAQTWYKIKPPSGEFRWVSGKFVDRQPPEDQPRQPSERNNLLLARHLPKGEGVDMAAGARDEIAESADDLPRRRRGYSSRSTPVNEEAELADAETSPRDPRRTKRAALWTDNEAASDPRTANRAANDGFRRKTSKAMSRPQRRVGERPAEPNPRPSAKSAMDDARASSTTARPRGDEALAEQLDEIDLALSAMVVRDVAEWDFAPMRTRTEALLARSTTALDRGRVRLVQRKIERYEEIKRRHDTVLTVQAKTDVRNRVLTSGLTSTRPADATRRFDGVGRLAQVAPGQTGAAGFALLDETGGVRYYVTPSPGVNLRPYLGREVGVNGTLGFMPDARTQHVTAKRITVVEDRMVR